MTSINVQSIIVIAKTVLGLVVLAGAYLANSPLGSKLDKRVTAALTFLSSDQISQAFDLATQLASGQGTGRQAAIDYLVSATKGTDLALSAQQAGAAVDWIIKTYDEGRALLAARSAQPGGAS